MVGEGTGSGNPADPNTCRGGVMSKRGSAVAAGIDVSAAELTVAASRDGQLCGGRSFENSHEGRRKVLSWLKTLGGQIRVCLEATGVYSLDVSLLLSREGVEVMVLNPRASADYAKARMQRSKTDAADAEVLLDYVMRMPDRKSTRLNSSHVS